MAEKWIEDLKASKRKAQEEQQRLQQKQFHADETYKARVGNLWTEAVGRVKTLVDQFNEGMPEAQRLSFAAPNDRTIVVGRDVQRRGHVRCEIDFDHRLVRARYEIDQPQPEPKAPLRMGSRRAFHLGPETTEWSIQLVADALAFRRTPAGSEPEQQTEQVFDFPRQLLEPLFEELCP